MSELPSVLAAVAQLEKSNSSDELQAAKAQQAWEMLNVYWKLHFESRPLVEFTQEKINMILRWFDASTQDNANLAQFDREDWTVARLTTLHMLELIQPMIDSPARLEKVLKAKATWNAPAASVLVSSILWDLPD